MNIRLRLLRDFDWRGMLTRDLGAKLGAGVLAVLLWLTVMSQQIAEREITIMVDYVNVPANLAITEGTQEQVAVLVKGSNQAISVLSGTTLQHLQLDISGRRAGTGMEPLTTGQIDAVLPRGVQAARITPERLNVVLEARAEKRVPVKVLTLNQPKQGYAVGVQRVNPATVRIAGPESLVNALQNVLTEGISLEGVSENLTRTLAVRPDRYLLLLDTAPVEATVEIGPELMRKTLTDVPVTLRNAPATGGMLQVNPARVTIEVEGPRDVVAGMGPTGLTCYIDGSRDDFMTSPVLNVGDKPDRVTVIRIDPPTVKIEH